MVALPTFVLVIVLRPRNAPRTELPKETAASHVDLARLGLLPVQPLARLADLLLELGRAWARTWRGASRWPRREPRVSPARAAAGSRAAVSRGRE